jgi:hypothetical protein
VVTGPIYVVHPPELRFPGIGDWILDVESVVASDPEWASFPLRWIPMRDDNGFRVSDVLSRVGSELGAVLIFDGAQAAPRQEVRQRLAGRTVVKLTSPTNSTELWDDLRQLRDLFASGEPFLPRRLVVSVLIIRKLYRHKYWGGSNEKNFIWGDEIGNGRGVDPIHKGIAQEIANFLRLKGILVVKYGGGKKGQKYALNPDRMADIEALANEGQCGDVSVRHWFFKDGELISARVLDGWTPI